VDLRAKIDEHKRLWEDFKRKEIACKALWCQCVLHATPTGIWHGCGYEGPGGPMESSKCPACGKGSLNWAYPGHMPTLATPETYRTGKDVCPECGAVANWSMTDNEWFSKNGGDR
jgi:endogenous inhibitor of DNA gyrase (YacG/DUF329 family)